MDLDSETIILEVQKHPCLYNINDSDFKNRSKKRDSWISVTAAVVGEDWEELGNEEKNRIGLEVQKRWKSMRDSYIKNMKSQLKKKYIYHKKMSFLNFFLNKKRTAGNLNSKDSTEIRAERAPEANETQRPDNHQKSKVTRASRSASKRKMDVSEEEEMINIASSVRPPIDKPDTDEMFLLSQLPVIKQLNLTDKMDFQVKFIQLLQSYTSPRISYVNYSEPSCSIELPNEMCSNDPGSINLFKTDPLSENSFESDNGN